MGGRVDYERDQLWEKESESQQLPYELSSEEEETPLRRRRAADRVYVDGGTIGVAPKTTSRQRVIGTSKRAASAARPKKNLTVKKNSSQHSSSSKRDQVQVDNVRCDQNKVYDNNNNLDGYDFDDEDQDGSFNWTVEETFKLLNTYREFKPQFDEPYSKKNRLWKKVWIIIIVFFLVRSPFLTVAYFSCF